VLVQIDFIAKSRQLFTDTVSFKKKRTPILSYYLESHRGFENVGDNFLHKKRTDILSIPVPY